MHTRKLQIITEFFCIIPILFPTSTKNDKRIRRNNAVFFFECMDHLRHRNILGICIFNMNHDALGNQIPQL